MYTSAYLIIQEHAVNSRSTAIDFGTSCSSESTIVHIALGKMLENVHFTIAKLPRVRVVKGLALLPHYHKRSSRPLRFKLGYVWFHLGSRNSVERCRQPALVVDSSTSYRKKSWPNIE
jgi:hypothetical protein